MPERVRDQKIERQDAKAQRRQEKSRTLQLCALALNPSYSGHPALFVGLLVIGFL